MNKFKSLFAQPLISSSAKIVPLRESPSDSAKRPKPAEIIPQKKIDSPAPILGKKSEKVNIVNHKRNEVKKHSAPMNISTRPSPISFNFEQYEDIVDTMQMKKRQGKFEVQEDNQPVSPTTPTARRHTWSTSDKDNIKFKKEFVKKPIDLGYRHSFSVKPEVIVPPPVVANRTLTQSSSSGIDGVSESFDGGGDSIRQELEENGVEFLEEFKKGNSEEKSSKKEIEQSDFFASHDRLKVGNLDNGEDKEENEREVDIDAFVNRKKVKNLTESPMLMKDFMTDIEREKQREIYFKVSVHQAIEERKAQNEKIQENLSAVSISSDSDVDSLMENNPFEDEKTIHGHNNVNLKRMQTRLREDERYSSLKLILFPDDVWRKVWDIVIVIALVYTALVMPVRIAFLTDDDGDDDSGDGDTLWTVIEYFVDCVFLGDIIITFFSAYFDHEDNLITSKRKIAWHYIKGWFILDVVSIIPFQLFSDVDSSNQRLNNLIRVARLPRLYRLVKIIKLARMVKIIRNRGQFLKYMNTVLKLGPAYERLLISIIGIFLFCHIASCIWFMLVGLSDPESGWLGANLIIYLPKFDQYMACFYLVVQTVTTVGYGDLGPKASGERFLAVFLMMIGVLCYSIFIGFLSSLINDTEIMNQIYNHKLSILHRLSKEYNLPVFFQKKLKTAIKYQNKQTMDSKHFISDLPTQLAVELACIMHRDIVESIAFLQNRPKGFIASLCPLLKPITVNKKDHIFMEGDPADEIFFIKSGTIGFVLPKYKNECFLKVREGYFFGEIDLLFYGEIRKYSAVALKDCELYVLNKKDFKHVFLSEHRDIGAALYDNAYMRKQRTRKAFKEAVEICKGFQQNHKHGKIRLSVSAKVLPPEFDGNSSGSDSLLGIVEEAEEEEDEEPETKKEIKPEDKGVPVNETKPLNPLMNLKVALALKRGLQGARKSILGSLAPPTKEEPRMRHSIFGSLVPPTKDEPRMRHSIFGSLIPPVKEENKFTELNKKLDNLESKMAQLAALGESMRERSSRGSLTMRRDSISSPGLEKSKTERNKSMLARVLALTPSNQSRGLPTDLKVPVDLSIGGVSPTGSDSSWGGLKSPNALKRQLIKKSKDIDGTPFQSVRISSPNGSQNDMESDRMISPMADLLTHKSSYLEFRAVNESLSSRSFNFDQSEREGESEMKEVKEVKQNKEEKPGQTEKLSAFRNQLRIGLKKITENEEEDVEKRNERTKMHNLLFIQDRRGSNKNPDKLDRKATMGESKEANSNVEVQEF